MLITRHSPPTYKWNTTFYGEVELQKDNKEFELRNSNFKVPYSWTPPKLPTNHKQELKRDLPLKTGLPPLLHTSYNGTLRHKLVRKGICRWKKLVKLCCNTQPFGEKNEEWGAGNWQVWEENKRMEVARNMPLWCLQWGH
jgi:hypothetical protein